MDDYVFEFQVDDSGKRIFRLRFNKENIDLSKAYFDFGLDAGIVLPLENYTVTVMIDE